MLSTLDWILISLLALSVLLGLWRGFITEVMSLGGWVVAALSAMYLAQYLDPYLVKTELSDSLRYDLALLIVFIITLIAWNLLTTAITRAMGAIGLGPFDRLLGAAFGALRGTLLLCFFVTLVGYTPIQKAEFWQSSQAVGWCHSAALSLKNYLPPAAAGFIH